jgi:hypothetical protein
MGYYTTHKLSIISENDLDVDFEQEIQEHTNGYANFEDSTKWYDCEDDMKSYSKKYPTIVFVIDGEGEESGDIWKAYFKNGKMFKTKAKLVFEEFSEDKLS